MKTTHFLKMSVTELCSLTQPKSIYVMPSWTTGGTDVICEEETEDSGERECERWRRREWGRQGKGERQKEGEEERCNEARLQG